MLAWWWPAWLLCDGVFVVRLRARVQFAGSSVRLLAFVLSYTAPTMSTAYIFRAHDADTIVPTNDHVRPRFSPGQYNKSLLPVLYNLNGFQMSD